MLHALPKQPGARNNDNKNTSFPKAMHGFCHT
jgi:hypothetical protein